MGLSAVKRRAGAFRFGGHSAGFWTVERPAVQVYPTGLLHRFVP